MSDLFLPQAVADQLLKVEKFRTSEDTHPFPDDAGGSLMAPLKSADGREEFFLDLWRGGVNLKKGRYQNRARKTIILARLDFEGAPHRNPDDEEIPCPHLHVYREGFGDKWAIRLPRHEFPNTEDKWRLFQDFMTYCTIVSPPRFDRGLFG